MITILVLLFGLVVGVEADGASLDEATCSRLIASVSDGDIATVRKMLDDTPELVDCHTRLGWTPLSRAARDGRQEIV